MPGMKPQGKVKCKWSSEMAYAVGLIATDGNLSKDGRHINFTSKDIDLIDSFKSCLNINNKVSEKTGGYEGSGCCFQVQFGDVLFYDWLVSIGLTHNKSKTMGEIKVPDQFFFDFLRGCFDGDGSIHAYWSPQWKTSYVIYLKFTSASTLFLEWLNRTIKGLVGISGNVLSAGRAHQLCFGKEKTKILLREFYYADSIPCLSRKFIKAHDILEVDALNYCKCFANAQVLELGRLTRLRI